MTCAGDAAAGPEAIDELAAIAAAAIASGAAALPDGGEAVVGVTGVTGTSVNATGAAIATAMAFCIVTAGAPGSVEVIAPVEAGVAESEAGFAVDFPAPLFKPVDFVPGCETALAVAPELASEDVLAVLSRPSESSLADGLEAPASCDRLSPEVADAPLERRDGAGCSGAEEGEGSLLVSVAELLSTSAPKLSFPCEESDLAALDGGAP